jgi:hypothetical protein
MLMHLRTTGRLNQPLGATPARLMILSPDDFVTLRQQNQRLMTNYYRSSFAEGEEIGKPSSLNYEPSTNLLRPNVAP